MELVVRTPGTPDKFAMTLGASTRRSTKRILHRLNRLEDSSQPHVRILWRNFKYAFLLIFIAAVLTPSPDALNQTLFAAPMVGLYLVSILIVWAAYPRR